MMTRNRNTLNSLAMALALTLGLSACVPVPTGPTGPTEGDPDATTSIAADAGWLSVELTKSRTDGLCEVERNSLRGAREAFTETCGGKARDCDPHGSAWICSSAMIGDNAPSRPDRCDAYGDSLTTARDAYAVTCEQPRRDCDPVNGRWQCSSVQIGNAAPPLANPSDNSGGNDTADERTREVLEAQVMTLLDAAAGGLGATSFTLPDSEDFTNIPQDPSNPLTAAKVRLGQMLFHDTGFALDGHSGDAGSWSCATCHHAAAGFKSGTRQGIGEGGAGFGANGSARLLAAGFDANAPVDATNKPDLQPFASPTILNSAWQDVMLWNGQFGNTMGGSINSGVGLTRLSTAGTPKIENERGLAGLETQAIAGSGVHRLSFEADSPLQTNADYQALWQAAYGDGSSDVTADAGRAMAAFERTVIANRAPFQQWLRGQRDALSDTELRGAELFFGDAGCVDCHRGPALSSATGAAADQMFFALGFDDLDHDDAIIVGPVADADRMGRGGFTGDANENYRFKIPPLYNLTDANVFGHGASFASVRAVVEHKNAGTVQNAMVPVQWIDSRVRPLSLSDADVDALVAFLSSALHDPDLDRYQPDRVPSGGCNIVNARDNSTDSRCP